MMTKIFARKASEQNGFPYVGTYSFDTKVTHHAVRPKKATAMMALAALRQELRRFNCDVIIAYDCYILTSGSVRVYAKVRFNTLEGACEFIGLDFDENVSEADRLDKTLQLLKSEEAVDAESHAHWKAKHPQDFVSYHDGKVVARIAQEPKYFPLMITSLYFIGHSAKQSSTVVARTLSSIGVSASKIHGYYTDKDGRNGEPVVLALVDIELKDQESASRFFDEGLCWPESVMHSGTPFGNRLRWYWNHELPSSDEELHNMAVEYTSIVKQAVEHGVVRELGKDVTARVANEVAILRPMVIPEFWCMNNGPNGADPIGSLIHQELKWLTSNGIRGAVPVKAVARAAHGVSGAENNVMVVAFRLELTPRMMLQYCSSMKELEGDEKAVLNFWQDQKAKHAIAGARYMRNKQYPDLEVFEVKRVLGRWTLRRIRTPAVASVIARHGLVVSRTAREMSPDHAWRTLITDAALHWPLKVSIVFAGHPGDSVVEPFKKFDQNASIVRNDGGRTMKPMTYVKLDIDNAETALKFAVHRAGVDDLPQVDGSDASRWFAYRMIDNLGRNNFNLDAPLIEYAEFKSSPKPVSQGLMDRLRKMLRL